MTDRTKEVAEYYAMVERTPMHSRPKTRYHCMQLMKTVIDHQGKLCAGVAVWHRQGDKFISCGGKPREQRMFLDQLTQGVYSKKEWATIMREMESWKASCTS